MMKQKKETGDSVMDHIRNEYHLKSSTGITDLFVQSVVPAEESAVVGVLVFGEPMSITVLLGLGCILLCVYILR